MNRTGILKDDRFMEHNMGPYHPESPKRLEAIYAMLEDPDIRNKFHTVPARFAERHELLWIHSASYIDRLEDTRGKEYTYLDPDTQTSAGSYDAALLAAGGLCEAISMVCSGELDNAFALVRPPGHHSEQSRAMGFCILNNIAIGARFAQKECKLKKILIADWDLHHGNGTQHSFEDDSSVLYFSTHQYPYYPGSGANNEIGKGEGKGFTVNVPLSTGYGDGEFISIYESILRSVGTAYNPDIILVSAGFDIHADDPLGGMRVTPKGFAGLTRSIMDIASACCNGRLVITLEGGYDLKGLKESIKEVLMELSGLSKTDTRLLMDKADKNMVDEAIQPVKDSLRRYWPDLGS
ncbi:MAG: histone deacetylase [Deltaproteobacteria bacterium]|nr:histone deacetylase [Deltaproteobacteria bacterium]